MRRISLVSSAALALSATFAACVGDDPPIGLGGAPDGGGGDGTIVTPPPGGSDEDGGPADADPPTPTGTLRWLKLVSGPTSPATSTVFTAGAIDAAGNVLVTGVASGPAGEIAFGDGKTLAIAAGMEWEGFIARYNADGVCQWVTGVSGPGDETLFRVAFSPLGEAIAFGETTSATVTVDGIDVPRAGAGRDLLVVKLDADGKRLWHVTAGGPDSDRPGGLAVGANGDIAIGGSVVRANGADQVRFPGDRQVTYPPTDADVAFVALLSASGDTTWARAFPPNAGATSAHTSVVRAVTFDPLGDVIVAGDFDHSVILSDSPAINLAVTAGTGFDGFVAKLIASDGRASWGTKIGGPADDRANDVTTDSLGNVYVGGSYTGAIEIGSHTMPAFGGADAYVAKLDPSGTAYAWARGFGGGAFQSIGSVGVDPRGHVVLGGRQTEAVDWGGKTSSGGGDDDGFAVKLDSTADAGLWAHGLGSAGVDLVGRVAVAPGSGRVVVTGGLNGSALLAGQSVAIPDGGDAPFAYVMVLDP